MSKNLSQTPKTAAIVEKIAINSSSLESKNYDEKYNAKYREVSRTKLSICPYYRYRYAHHNGKAR